MPTVEGEDPRNNILRKPWIYRGNIASTKPFKVKGPELGKENVSKVGKSSVHKMSPGQGKQKGLRSTNKIFNPRFQ
jgi:hypothetical protein